MTRQTVKLGDITVMPLEELVKDSSPPLLHITPVFRAHLDMMSAKLTFKRNTSDQVIQKADGTKTFGLALTLDGNYQIARPEVESMRPTEGYLIYDVKDPFEATTIWVPPALTHRVELAPQHRQMLENAQDVPFEWPEVYTLHQLSHPFLLVHHYREDQNTHLPVFIFLPERCYIEIGRGDVGHAYTTETLRKHFNVPLS